MWGIQKNNKKNEIRKFFFSISKNVRFLEKLPLNKGITLPNIIFDNISIPYVEKTKLLGVIIDNKIKIWSAYYRSMQKS